MPRPWRRGRTANMPRYADVGRRWFFGALGEEGARYDFDAGFEVGLDILVKGVETIAGKVLDRELAG